VDDQIGSAEAPLNGLTGGLLYVETMTSGKKPGEMGREELERLRRELDSLREERTRWTRSEAELERYREHMEEVVAERTARLEQTTRELKREVAERLQAEAEISTLKDFYESIVESTVTGVWVADASDVIQYANRGMEAIAGIPVQRIIGARVLEDFPKNTLGHFSPIYLRARESLRATYYETVPMVTPGGRLSYQSGWLLPRVKGGAFDGMICTVEDITERKRAEDELARHREHLQELVEERSRELAHSEARFRALTESTSDWIWEVNERAEYVYASPKVSDLLGYEPAEVLGKTPFDLMPAEESERIGDEFRAVAEARRSFDRLVNVNTHKDGRPVVLETSGVPVFDADGEFRGYRGIDRDVTERRRAEEQLARYAAELERSNRELEQFAYVASHDLQEPLRMISSFVKLLERRYKGALDEDADDYIHFAVDGADRMKRLIDDLLVYARVGPRGLRVEAVRMEDALQDAMANMRAVMEDSGAEVEHGELPEVEADRTRLVQLLQNLLGNAIKFRKEEPPRLTVEARRRPGEWQFSVKDNGIGIDPRYLEQIFVIFKRLHRKDAYPGTGIGLAVCQKIVECLGGRIWAESEPGEGATFFFTIPDRRSP